MKNIKSCLLAILLIVAGIKSINAQEKLSLGLSSQIQNTQLVVSASNPGVKGAYRPTSVLFAEYSLGKNMAVHTGLGYTMMTQNSDAFKNNFHYLALPLYLKHGKIKEGKRIAFTGFYGTNLHYLLKAEHLNMTGDKTDIMEQSRKFHFDLVVGSGLKYRLTDQIEIEALVSFSMGYMVNKYNPAFADVHNINTGYMLNLSYKLK